MIREHCCNDSPLMMNNLVSRERELEIDIESGGTTSEEDGINDLVSEIESRQSKKVLNTVWSGHLSFDGSVRSSRFSDIAGENVELLLSKNSNWEEGHQKNMGFGNKKVVEEKQKKKNSRKALKPPRPPKGPSLDAADQKLVQQITELAMKKRAKMERIKALKKTRAAKSSSWNSTLFATVITTIFCIILVFQGVCARNSGSLFLQGSPEPGVAASEDLISIQFYKKPANENDGPGSGSPSMVEGQVSGSGLGRK